MLEWSTLLVLHRKKYIDKHLSIATFIRVSAQQRLLLFFSLLVVSLPELDGSDVGGDEDGAAQEGIEWRGEDGGDHRLDEQHGGVCRGRWSRSLFWIFTSLCDYELRGAGLLH